MSLRAAIEQLLLVAKPEPINLSFLETKEAQRDFAAQGKIFVAVFLYRSKAFLASDQETSAPAQSSETQQEEQHINQKRATTAMRVL